MYRDEHPPCCACDHTLAPNGPRLACDGCGGVFLPVAHLTEMLQSMGPDDARSLAERLTPREDSSAVRTCPRCSERMTSAWLERVAVDSCSEHGIWFDEHELGWVLETVGVAWGRRNPSTYDTASSRRETPPPQVNRAGIPEAPALRRTFWQKLFGVD